MNKQWIVLVAALLPLALSGCATLSQFSSGVGRTTTTVTVTVAQSTAAIVASADPHTAARTAHAAAPSRTPTTTAQRTATPAAPTSTTVPSVTATATVAPTPVILAPVDLGQAEVGGTRLLPRYWTNTKAIAFTMAPAPGSAVGLRPQLEVQPLARPFTGTPSATGPLITPGQHGTVILQVAALAEGPYHWQARLSDGHGHAGPWAVYYQGPAFRLVRTPPDAPRVTSPTDPNQQATYGSPMAELSWTTPHAPGGIQGYQTGVDRNPHGLPSGALSAANQTAIGPLANGLIYFHVRAVDWAGNLGKVATYVLHIDHRPPTFAHVFFQRFQFNPQFDPLVMHFVPDKTVQVTVNVRRQSTKGIVRVLSLGLVQAGATASVTWDGRDARGVLVQPDQYTLEILARDSLGNVGDAVYTDLTVNYRKIVVHLASQSIDVYDGTTLLRSTLVTTGNQRLPTPPGVWHVGAKFHPYTFLSPWPKSSPYWYPTSNVNYALYFHTGGYFIHDAPWRTVFGPGTNADGGIPGSNIYTGSHGCVETPTDFAAWLYSWAPIGTVVDVVQ